jgi:hypothetical protein
MNCLFCPKIEIKNQYDQASICLNCKTNYYFDCDDLIGWQFSLKYRGIMFWATYTNSISEGLVIRKELMPIAQFADPLSITPHNFLQKLPTILTFL